jgi:hypothetical protein
VKPFFVVDDAHDFVPPRSRAGEAFGPESHPESGVTFRGTRRDLTIADVVRDIGPRSPDATSARHRFRMAFVLVVPAGTTATPLEIAKLERARRAFGPFFRRATSGRARMQTWLPRLSPQRGPSRDPELVSGLPRVLHATARKDVDGRAVVALDFVDFDADLTTLEVSTDASHDVPAAVVDVTLGAFGARRGSLSFALSEVPPDAREVRLTLVDKRGQRSAVFARRVIVARGAAPRRQSS